VNGFSIYLILPAALGPGVYAELAITVTELHFTVFACMGYMETKKKHSY
jgi:hypothetical protein